MDEKIQKIIDDLKSKINIKDIDNITVYSDGATDSIVFSIGNMYLVKTMNDKEIDITLTFLKKYKDIKNFQRVITINYNLNYICFEFIDGKKQNVITKEKSKKYIPQIYNIVSNYSNIPDFVKFGYLDSPTSSWIEFLKEETNNAIKNIDICTISLNKLHLALENLVNTKEDFVLLHGDFGFHNFLIDDNDNINVIDPMPVYGDRLYDFYFALLSNASLLSNLTMDYILSFFEKEDIKKKKNLLLVCIFIRMCRCYKYNRKDYPYYLNLYNNYGI